MPDTETSNLSFFQHEIGGKFFFSLDENPDDGMVGPFDTAEDCSRAINEFIEEHLALSVKNSLFGA